MLCNMYVFMLLFYIDFDLLKLKYKEILEYFPKDCYQTLQKLQDKLSDDQICTILNCSSFQIANKMILDYLIDSMKCREDLLDLCDQLDRLTDISPNLQNLIDEIRQGTYIVVIYVCIYIYMHSCIHMYVFIGSCICIM